MFCKMLGPQSSQGSANSAQIRDAFVLAHAQCECDRKGLRLVLADSAVRRIANDAQLKMVWLLNDAVHCFSASVVLASGVGRSGMGFIP
jgi:hypothetical protein